ncbi:MAG: DUF1836 domain-containing protein [Anaerorhabdus sp.]
MEKELEVWTEKVCNVHLPRWEELPDVSLYKEDVITIIEKYIDVLIESDWATGITPSMINNYVKWKMIPPPEKRQYNRVHLGYLIAITILKQVMPIAEIKDGIKFQSTLNGTHKAYNYFCEEQEKALRYVCSKINSKIESEEIEAEIEAGYIALKMASLAFATKLISLKKVKIQQEEERREGRK